MRAMPLIGREVQLIRYPEGAVRPDDFRVADIQKAYAEWSAKGAEFLTEPKDHGREIRAYIRDPDGHLIEVGQTTGL